jgi:hypothetical protein
MATGAAQKREIAAKQRLLHFCFRRWYHFHALKACNVIVA